ncbi:MAG TPA: OB-fold domain-containing protein, partial [Candidatus Binatia bacterium]|nr:OB-fold domain-containing protein [Candidatus Binatia bacterium]
ALEPETEHFWRACRAGRLEILRCRDCGWYVHPPRPICPRCRRRDVAWEPVSRRGTVTSFTVNHQRWFPGMEVPYIIGLVELAEQADLRLTTNIVGCAPDAVRIGMSVQVTFRPASDEIALPLFEPASDTTPAARLAVQRPAITRAIRPSSEQRLERRAILSGVGQSQIGRRLFRTDLDLTCEAALAAIADAGLTPKDIDGLACYPGPMGAGAPGFAGPGTPDVQDALGLQLGWHGSGGEGPGQIAPVMLAALAIGAGLCRHALVYRTVTEATAAADTGRRGIGAGSRTVSGFAQWTIPFGAMSAANWLALHAVRHMHEFGTRREHLGEIALTGRAHAALNPAAIYREPMTMDDYLRARMITWPFGLYDCDVPVDGSTAVVVSPADAARDLPHPAVRIHAIGTSIRSRPVWDQWEDLTTMAARDAAEQLWARADIGPSDVDTVQLYDGFSWLTLAWLEALGFCKRGESGPFVEGGRLRLGGELPLNTWGGQLSGGRLHGFGFLAEGIRQVRRECGPRQVPDCEVALVAAGGGPIAGCLLLTR